MPFKNYKTKLAYNLKWNHAHRDQLQAVRRADIARNERYVSDYLFIHPCVDCGETDVVVLEFDHVRGGKRKYCVTALIDTRATIAFISKEISKCDVRCCNCHRRRHYQKSQGVQP